MHYRRSRVLALLVVAVLVVPAGLWKDSGRALADSSSGDAYAHQGANACTWTMGTSGIEKTVTYNSSTTKFTLTSFKNKLPATVKEYVQGSVVSPEFRFTWDGSSTATTGNTAGWSCSSGTSSLQTIGGLTVVQVDIALTRTSAPLNVQVNKHYVIFPSESVIREWTEYKNTDTAAHTLGSASIPPSILEQHVMSSDVSAGQVVLNYMSGALCCSAPSWTLQSTTLTSTYLRNFDSYDDFGCVDSGSTPGVCQPNGPHFAETSSDYIPWFSLFNTSGNQGTIMGFDYSGRWQAPIGATTNGDASLSLNIPNYNSSLAAGATVTMPVAFVMTYVTDLDDMANRVLDWQYRYLWDDTRSGYFGAVRAPGNWCAGTQWLCTNIVSPQWDQQGIRQKIYNLSDRERTIGLDADWRDNGWWQILGDWNGPDFKLTDDLLAASGIKQIIYYHAQGANTNSQAYTNNPSWFTNGSPCGYMDRLGDLSISAFETYMENLLISKAQQYGDYEWRHDACWVNPVTGSQQLAEDQAFRRVVQGFLNARPGSSYFNVDSGGNEIGWDIMRMSSAINSWDSYAPSAEYTASYLFPMDKMSGDPNGWSDLGYCSRAVWQDEAMNLSFYSSADGTGFGAGDTTDPANVECARELTDTYHYLESQGVAGRWVKQYHPSSSDGAGNWFERLSSDATKGTIHRFGADTTSSITVYPKGLIGTTTYDVRYQFTSGSASRTGSDLMTNGITFSTGVSQGELIYLNLANHPGSVLDTTAPTAPSGVTAASQEGVNYPGVGVSWTAGTDDNWVSYYNIYRDGSLIGKLSKGTFYYDHSPAASPYARYGVQTVDGAGNVSGIASSVPIHTSEATAVDDPALTYTGFTHSTGVNGAYKNTISSSSTTTDSASYSFSGSGVTYYAKLGPDEGLANVTIDGSPTPDAVDLYAPDSLDYQVPIYSKTWSTSGSHTIRISPRGAKNNKSTGNTIYIDGLQITSPTQTSVPASDTTSITYTGTWSQVGNSHQSSTTGSSASYSFNSSRIRVTGQYCSACGEADVLIDNVYDARIDFSGDRLWSNPSGTQQVDQTIVYDKSFPTSGSHTIKIVVDGTKNLEATGTTVKLDSFQTDNGGQAPPAATSAFSQAVIADNPVGWWRLNEPAGVTTALDSTTNADAATVHGGVTFANSSGLLGDQGASSAALDGSTGWLDLGNPSALQVTTGSVEGWFNTTNTDANYHTIAIKWEAYGLFVHNGHLVTYDWGSNTERDTGVSVADGKWHQAVLTFQSGVTNGTKIYLDGALKLTTTITISTNTLDGVIGAGDAPADQEFFPGSLQDISFYNTQLSAARVSAHYTGATAYSNVVSFDAPAGQWRLGDPSGSTTAADSSGHGDTGAVHGGVTFGVTGPISNDTTTAAQFDGSTGWIDLANPSQLQLTSGSLEAWFKTTNSDSNYHAIAIKWYAYGLFVHNGHLVTFDWTSGAERDTGISVADGNWHHAVLTFQSGVNNGTVVYLDGASKLTTLVTVSSNGSNAIIGAGNAPATTEFFPGTLAQVAYYGCVLSSTQVSNHYHTGHGS